MPARVFVVTGGTGALGAAVVGRLLEEGAAVHVPWIEPRELDGFAHRNEVSLKRVDLQVESDVTAFYGALPSLWGSIHVAGGFAMAPIAETSAAEFERLWRLNALTCFLCCREAVRAIRRGGGAGGGAGGGGGGGRLVNVGARPALAPVGGMTAYSASKAAVISVTQSIAEETRRDGILVNAVVPSIMDTPANRAAMPTADYAAWPKVGEVAEAIAWLAGDANTLTSGVALPVYGRA